MGIMDFLTKYWSQILVGFTIVGFVVKFVLERRSKKMEINHSLFQQNRINTVNNFFTYYAKAELMWLQIGIYEILEHKIPAKEIDKLILPTLNDLNRTVLELKMYFDAEDHTFFQQLAGGFGLIHGKLLNLYSDLSLSGKNIISREIDFTQRRDEILNKNMFLIDELCLRIRKSFKSKF